MTVEPTRTLRPVSSAVKILFTYEIVAQDILEPYIVILLHKFELKSIDELYEYALSYAPDQVTTFTPGEEIYAYIVTT